MLFTLTKKNLNNPTTTTKTLLKIQHFTLSLLYSTLQPVDFDPLNPKPLTKPQLKTLISSNYHHGKFTNLLQNVVASPSLLFTAAQNLTRSPQLTLNSVSTRFNLSQLAHQLTHNQFHPKDHILGINPPQKCQINSGFSIVLPNLQLKVVIEAIRLILDAIYDGGFVTFCYGGREGLGRHTIVRYLKNVVEDPKWWFVVKFDGVKFGDFHVGKLCSLIGEKVDDLLFVGLIERLFECDVLRIELGRGEFGKGLPQECGLCGILVNIYFNGFDKKVQRIRLRVNEANVGVDGVGDSVVYKPVKVYAVRYIDEIMVITSGSKGLAMNLLKWGVGYLEEELALKVDRLGSCVHSAVCEKIEFLGFELRAVTPSVLRPPLSEKAKRARKKWLRQKEVRLSEMKNARERNRRMLGRKILRHVFKKLKKTDGFEFEYQIEDEVREIFRTWADDVVKEFLGSLEERANWYRQLTAGDFLSLKRIREQLPQELVDAYDKFREEVDSHLSPVKLQKALQAAERKEEEEEEKKYSKRTVDDLTKLCMKVTAPMELVKKAVRLAGFTNSMGRPRPISLLTALEDADIIKWYAGVGRRWLEFFACCRNIRMVKIIVSYHLRFSCLLTLAEKHDATKMETIRHYTKDLKVLDLEGNEEAYFPTEREVRKMGDYHLADPKPVDGALTMTLIRLAYDEPLYTCAAHFCDRKDTITYRVSLLQNRLNIDPMDRNNWVPGMAAIHEGLDRKCFPLCAEHVSELYMSRMCLQDIDCTSFVDVD